MREREMLNKEREVVIQEVWNYIQVHNTHILEYKHTTTEHTHAPCINPTIIPDATAGEDGDREPKFVLEPILGAPEKAAVGVVERRMKDLVLSESQHWRLI